MIIQSNPRNWQILVEGSPEQQKAFEAIRALQIFVLLERYDPAHVGTIGNGLNISGSDIDIVCCAADLDAFESFMRQTFGHLSEFTVSRKISRGALHIVASFEYILPVEIYCESAPVEKQLGFRHYVLTCQLLSVAGERLRNSVRRLKELGMKTEPALAHCLGLEGDPYLSLLQLEGMSNDEIMEFLAQSPFMSRNLW
jgi:hypothetical protein